MKLHDKVVVVTGGARGIGRAMVRRFAAEKPSAIIVADRDREAAEVIASEIGGTAIACDVGREDDIRRLIDRTRDTHGRIDLFCSNAGIATGKGVEASDAEWQRIWDINLMSHVWAARALVPSIGGAEPLHFLVTASAAGLMSMIGDAPYAVTKHAAVAFAEWLSITYGDRGLSVSCLCPLFVNTDLLTGALTEAGGRSIPRAGTVLEPEQVAEAVVAGLETERFLILPHPEVAKYVERKAADHDRWIASMRKLRDTR
jgi:NAD(P)-dependent dehydrogenase (short-subunit alcohol dehydrogenase family)